MDEQEVSLTIDVTNANNPHTGKLKFSGQFILERAEVLVIQEIAQPLNPPRGD